MERDKTEKSKSAGWYKSAPFEGTGIPVENTEQVRPRSGGHCTCSWISFYKNYQFFKRPRNSWMLN